MMDKLKSANVDGSLPTLIITECILIYMKAEDSNTILDWTRKYFG